MRFDVNGGTSWDRFQQYCGTVKNNIYRVSFWMKTVGVTGNFYLISAADLQAFSDATLYLITNTSGNWVYFTKDIFTTHNPVPGGIGIMQYGNIGVGTLFIDAISVKLVS